MARVELGQGKTEMLPPGNRWNFSPRNRWLNPQIYQQEYRDLSHTSEAVQRLVRGVQEQFIQDGWSFTSVMGSDRGFAIVFADPNRLTTTQVCPPPDFLKPEATVKDPRLVGKNTWQLPTKPVNTLLEGTNLYAYNSHGAYNHFELEGQEGLLVKKPKTLTYYQSGIAYVHTNLYNVQDEIWIADGDIEELRQEFESKAQPLQVHRERMLAIQSTSPQILFGNPQS